MVHLLWKVVTFSFIHLSIYHMWVYTCCIPTDVAGVWVKISTSTSKQNKKKTKGYTFICLPLYCCSVHTHICLYLTRFTVYDLSIKVYSFFCNYASTFPLLFPQSISILNLHSLLYVCTLCTFNPNPLSHINGQFPSSHFSNLCYV